MANGLNHGMVDSLEPMVTGKYWTFGQCLRGTPAYIFVTGTLKYKSKNNPYLSAGNKPLFAIFPADRGTNIFFAIISTAKISYY